MSSLLHFAYLFLSLVLFFVGLSIQYDESKQKYEAEAIKHNSAYYHPQTGEFTWKECK